MDDKKKSKSVTLKRTVTIKAIVTEDFRKYLVYELQNSIKSLDEKLQQMEIQGKQLVEMMTKQGALDQISSIKQQIELERVQQKSAKDELTKRVDEAQSLPIDSEFVQGTIDGFVSIKPGDNLYQKLGAMEIIIKDGIIQDITGDVEEK
ncbi:MAG: hypothetical protein DKM50_07000 [Candidatus Margulisiibacteriota bacterium]|nr:MAG: hypothetical protein A2X43_10955 [Candidatus Margulisbacteria bacterium GWD2_39_127]OGI03057.1 MAG: hypothetical protein A2X42_05010 [Candidatus Margulisbacteria bacterium GWF2_38_17]OGI11614.1 MAG: hypothetical protein A2X41_04155 [Candidatus Margulisbacteria bacterium GWE2_39_32]PZM79922.1 MAG: hypothetical protein DKM50_07000 [Candidatus Margulisiibacteriota bacterium]HAR62840.1 hypothetical protein [Candidatus Margulisiibacteriota bacterium]